jgi:hypothetical protein
MVTVLQVWDNERRRWRACDARCYDGKGKRCRCVCGGANHGKGLEEVVEGLDEVAKGLGGPGLGVRVCRVEHTLYGLEVRSASDEKDPSNHA